MIFDFKKFSSIATAVFPGGLYSLEESLSVFQYYFQKYEDYFGRPHPPIRTSQIVHIAKEMPWVFKDDRGSFFRDVEPENYFEMIDKHFNTRYRRCDYNINHFFSGRIRELRLLEIDRGE